ncbi:MAG: CBO2463/CBO2479 domain-containing protein [Porphyromonadaceae bacterium]|uniref:Uncharacterized protein n=1 Tax=Peptostreptococcus russellii TaxID=215200 RepID=A0A1H8KBV3_9FIRM|nr:CBO2463/CBO2479 domain-containing protein [Peptostreptococcus russellii]MDO4671904.1 CBO2463/CBO2479 domain-containing protein [Porphyromonadaceae bacterium]SEN90227.1 hypothetical protein SAMN05216454_1277 [Peptostreptococcus russellii]
MIDYQINPVLMGGTIKSISSDGTVKINLRGRLGVLKVPSDIVINKEELEAGKKLQFFFSYLRVIDKDIEFDDLDLNVDYGLNPTILGGKFLEVNDTAVEVGVMNGKGTVAVPRRWVFTENDLEENNSCEFYLSCMQVVS